MRQMLDEAFGSNGQSIVQQNMVEPFLLLLCMILTEQKYSHFGSGVLANENSI